MLIGLMKGGWMDFVVGKALGWELSEGITLVIVGDSEQWWVA